MSFCLQYAARQAIVLLNHYWIVWIWLLFSSWLSLLALPFLFIDSSPYLHPLTPFRCWNYLPKISLSVRLHAVRNQSLSDLALRTDCYKGSAAADGVLQGRLSFSVGISYNNTSLSEVSTEASNTFQVLILDVIVIITTHHESWIDCFSLSFCQYVD